jgi:DNA-binding PadR family transcriptional regulator
MRRGGIRRAVLSALQEGPAHGYEVMSRLEQRTGGMWRPSPGSVYPTLQMLEDEGLVRSEASGGTRTYTLTEAGETEAQAAAEAGPGPFGGAPGRRPLRPLIEAMGQLEAAVHGVARSGDEDQVQRAADVVRQTARTLHGLLADAPGGDTTEH